MEKICQFLFILIGFITIFEFYFISGIFTGPLMMILSLIFGITNVFFEFKNKHYLYALLFLLTTISLNIGYLKLM